LAKIIDLDVIFFFNF